MDVKWKDGEGNILNANNERIIYYGVETDSKTKLTKEEVKKITIEDGLMNIFKDFENELALTIVIPKKSKRNAVRIFNEYDKTGEMYKKGTGNILLDVFLNVFVEFSLNMINPISVLFTVPLILLLVFGVIRIAMESILGSVGTYIAYIALFGYPVYMIVRYVLLRIKRKKIKEV